MSTEAMQQAQQSLPPPQPQPPQPPQVKDNSEPTPAPPPAPAAPHAAPPAGAAASAEAEVLDQPFVCPAKKYIFSNVTSSWKEMDAVIRIPHPDKILGHGGMRVCFSVDDVDEEGAGTPMVAKMFRHNIVNVTEKDYFNEGAAQCMCEEFADNFNRIHLASTPKPNISFLQCYVVRIPKANLPEDPGLRKARFFRYKTEDTHEVMFVMEPKLTGHFTKYNSNYGQTYREEKKASMTMSQIQHRTSIFEAAEAFSHFTLVESGGSMLVCDLQGVKDFLTDPQIHTEDGKGLGMGNMGQDGIDKWVEKHVCNDICRELGMQPFNGVLPPTNKDSREKNHYINLRAMLQKQNPVRPQDLVPLTKPLDEMTEDERVEYAMRLSALTS